MSKTFPVYIDFESFFSQDYSLSKLTPVEYVMGDRYETISCATRIGDGETIVTFGHDETAALFDTIDWSNAIAVGHNMSGFDALIAAWHFRLKPKAWACTLAMARPHLELSLPNMRLGTLAEHYGLQAKGSLEATNTKGKYLADFTPDEIEAMRVYNKIDTEICAGLFKILLPKTPKRELHMIDHTIRMLVEPRFRLDAPLLASALEQEKARVEGLLSELAIHLGMEATQTDEVRTLCASAPKFKALLEAFGAEVPMKVSPTTGKEIPALAKNDKGMEALLEHPDERVQAAAMARLGVKSTQLESRLERFLTVNELCGGKMPVALKYHGASTGRWSGDFKLNQANLPRVGKKPKISDALRKSMIAPPGKKVVVADLSGIELRVNHFLWNVEDSMAAFEADPEADLYKTFASYTYGIPVEEITKGDWRRTAAKVAQLQLGYGSGWKTYQDAARIQSGGELIVSDHDAKEIVNSWRTKYAKIVSGWDRCEQALEELHDGNVDWFIDDWELCKVVEGGILMPRGMLRYPKLHREADPKARKHFNWVYGVGRNKRKAYGGLLVENICQTLSRHILVDAMMAYHATELGRRYPVVHHVYDEMVVIANDADAQDVLDTMQACLRTSPAWWPEIVLWSEGDIGQSWGDAK